MGDSTDKVTLLPQYKAALAADSGAQVYIAEKYLGEYWHGGSRYENEKGTCWLELAAQARNHSAMNVLAYVKLAGLGMHGTEGKDQNRAFELYSALANANNRLGYSGLGSMHENGWGPAEKDLRKALAYFEKAKNERAIERVRAKINPKIAPPDAEPREPVDFARKTSDRCAFGDDKVIYGLAATGWRYSDGSCRRY